MKKKNPEKSLSLSNNVKCKEQCEAVKRVVPSTVTKDSNIYWSFLVFFSLLDWVYFSLIRCFVLTHKVK